MFSLASFILLWLWLQAVWPVSFLCIAIWWFAFLGVRLFRFWFFFISSYYFSRNRLIFETQGFLFLNFSFFFEKNFAQHAFMCCCWGIKTLTSHWCLQSLYIWHLLSFKALKACLLWTFMAFDSPNIHHLSDFRVNNFLGSLLCHHLFDQDFFSLTCTDTTQVLESICAKFVTLFVILGCINGEELIAGKSLHIFWFD